MPSQILLPTLGSAGDVYPFIRLGLALQARGHQATLITNPHFEAAARQAGLNFIPLGTDAFYEMITTHPDLWHPSKGPMLIAEQGMPLVLRPLYDILCRFDPARTVVVGSSAAIAGRIMQELCAMPLATVYLQPAYLFSVNQTPRMSSVPWLDKAPRPIKRWMGVQIGKFLDNQFGPQVNAFRAEIGLPAVPSFSAWLNSPQRIIGMFPEWFAPVQADWPSQTRLTGFPLYDGPQAESFPESLQDFLAAGSRPIVFTLGTAMRQGKQFFAESIEACRLLGRRGILVTRYRDQLPESLPDTIYHATYAPFGTLFKHAAAMVSAGSIGTISQALAAGIPQLVVPMSHDQPDNALRIERLGVGTSLKNYRAVPAANKLKTLLNDPTVKARCQQYANKVDAEAAIRDTCTLIEELIPAEAA